MGVKQKRVPLRMCVGCREKKDKKELLRIVRTPEGEVLIDPSGKKAGRGVYLCTQKKCLEKALKNRLLEKALNVQISKDLSINLLKNL